MEALAQNASSCRTTAQGFRAGNLHKTVAPIALRPQCSTPRLIVNQAVKTTEAPTTTTTTTEVTPQQSGQEIYIGFAKGDYAPRTGRKGRFIKDNPKKYPAKENVGFLPGATGGWAGGEAALWQLREQVQKEKSGTSSSSTSAPSTSSSSKTSTVKPPPSQSETQAAIYLGYSKDELEKRKSGAPGRFILDDPKKYPAKEDLAFLTGATGGFAGGEKGLKQFVETGELKIRDPNAPGSRKQYSPVALAGLMVLAGAGGGLLLNEVTDLGESALNTEILQAPIDDNTKILLLGAVGLLAGASIIGAGRAAVQSVEERLTGAGEGAKKLAITGGFWLLVFLAARFVLEL